MKMVKRDEEEEGELLFCDKKGRVVPPADEIAKSRGKGAHHPFYPAGGARRWQSGPEVGTSGPVDQGTSGFVDQGTSGPVDQGTSGSVDQGTSKFVDQGTSGAEVGDRPGKLLAKFQPPW